MMDLMTNLELVNTEPGAELLNIDEDLDAPLA